MSDFLQVEISWPDSSTFRGRCIAEDAVLIWWVWILRLTTATLTHRHARTLPTQGLTVNDQYLYLLLKREKVQFSVSKPWRHIGGLEWDLHSFLLSAIEGSEWLASRPGSFIPGKESRYPFYSRLDGPRAGLDCFGEEKMLLSLPGLEPRTVQPIGNCCTDTDKQNISVSDLLPFVIELLVRSWFNVVQLTNK